MSDNEKEDQEEPLRINILYQIKVSPQVITLPSVWNWILLNLTSKRPEQEINPASHSQGSLDVLEINGRGSTCVCVYVNERHRPCPLLWRLRQGRERRRRVGGAASRRSVVMMAAALGLDSSLSFPVASNHLRFTAPRLAARRERALIVSCKHIHAYTSNTHSAHAQLYTHIFILRNA